MLKILELTENEVSVGLTFRATEKEDYLLAQRLFRYAVTVKFCVESSFGYDENFQEAPVFKYPKSRTITLQYNWQTREYTAIWDRPRRRQDS